MLKRIFLKNFQKFNRLLLFFIINKLIFNIRKHFFMFKIKVISMINQDIVLKFFGYIFNLIEKNYEYP